MATNRFKLKVLKKETIKLENLHLVFWSPTGVTKQALGPDFCTAVKCTPGPGLNSVILVVVSEVHVGTKLNSAVTEVPTKRRHGTVWHHGIGAHGNKLI